ncbi:MAG: hypothetical protein ACP5T9_06390 [Thermoplasmata archaeon]
MDVIGAYRMWVGFNKYHAKKNFHAPDGWLCFPLKKYDERNEEEK